MFFYRFLSAVAFAVAMPWLVRKYRVGNDQRQGYFSSDVPRGSLWVHSVSVGEVQSAFTFLKEVRQNDCDLPLIVSSTTTTGRKMAEDLMSGRVDSVIYYPWDAPSIISRALDALKPVGYVTMETEIWPGILDELSRRGIPSFLVNGRLSEQSYGKYNRMRWFWRKVIDKYSALMVRSEDDKERFVRLGISPDKVFVTGDCKIDALVDRKSQLDLGPLKREIGYREGDVVILAGSTHEGEDSVVFEALRKVLAKRPEARLILVPRHPQRAEGLLDEASGFGEVCLLSQVREGWRVLVVDRIGVLFPLYALADVAFIGGSLAPKGGQNIMEPAIFGVPFCQGPHHEDFPEASRLLSEIGICREVASAEEMAEFFVEALGPGMRHRYLSQSEEFFKAYGGASGRNWEIIRSRIGR